MNPEGDNTSIDLIVKILKFQQSNEDQPVPGTCYSSHFIDVQLRSLEDLDIFSPVLFERFLETTTDRCVCQHIWKNYQELLARVIVLLNSIDEPKDEGLPVFVRDFLRMIGRLLRMQVDLNRGKIQPLFIWIFF